MINSIEYTKGNLQVKIDGHRHVLTSANPSLAVAESDLTNELLIVKAAGEAVFPLSTRSEGIARFNEATGLIKWQGQVITPESDLSGLPEDISAFATALRTTESIAAFNSLKEPEYEQEEYEFEGVVVVNDVPTLVKETRKRDKMRKVRVKNPDGSPAFTEKIVKGKTVKSPLFVEVPIVI